MPKPGPRTTYRYSRDFKATAVRLSQLPGVAVRDVAASLYIHPFMLSRWRKQAQEGLIMTKVWWSTRLSRLSSRNCAA